MQRLSCPLLLLVWRVVRVVRVVCGAEAKDGRGVRRGRGWALALCVLLVRGGLCCDLLWLLWFPSAAAAALPFKVALVILFL